MPAVIFILAISSVAALGGLLFGFDTAIISGAAALIRDFFGLTDYALGWAVSSILIGCAAGALLAGACAERWGRRSALMGCAVIFAISGVGTGFAHSFSTFIVFRLLGGVGVGAAAIVSPLYIAETAPAAWRGRLVSLYQLSVVMGILLAFACSLSFVRFGPEAWRWMFVSQTVPAIALAIALCAVPETPRWLVKRGRLSEAAAILGRILGRDAARLELQSIERSFLGAPDGISVRSVFTARYRPVLLIGIGVAVFQQVTGINAILYYAPIIFAKTGLDAGSSLMQTLAVGGVNLAATVGAILLVDKLGRKRLLQWGSAMMGLSLGAVATCFHYEYYRGYAVLVFMLLYVAAFACTLGAVTWVYLSEIFPNRIRAAAMSIATLALWLADFLVAYTFPVLNQRLGIATTLLCYAGACVASLVFVLRKVPETKGRRLEELEALFSPGSTS